MKKVILYLSVFLPSTLRIFILRLFGFNISKKAHLGIFSLISGSRIEIGDYSKIGMFSIVSPDADLIMKENAEISSFVLIYGGRSLKMDSATYIGPKCVVNVTRTVTMGYYSGIGPGTYIYTHGVWLPYTEGFPRKFAEVTLEENVWVPAKAFIAPGVTIHKNSMIASGAVIYKDIPANVFFKSHNENTVPLENIKKNVVRKEKVAELINEFCEELALNKTFTYKALTDKWVITYKGSDYEVMYCNAAVQGGSSKSIYLFEDKGLVSSFSGSCFFCFSPFVASKQKNPIHAKLKAFFERECGIRFGIDKELGQYFVSRG
jgi:acetyltransferase-like isoleucine patch superfamily enzyme